MREFCSKRHFWYRETIHNFLVYELRYNDKHTQY